MMAQNCRRAMQEAGLPDQEGIKDFTIGSIDWKTFAEDPDLGVVLGLDPKGDPFQAVASKIYSIHDAHRLPGTESLESYQPEAIGFWETRAAFADFLNQWGTRYTPEQTILCYGSLSGIDNILGALAYSAQRRNVETVLLFPAPGFSVVAAQAKRRNIRVETVPTHPEEVYCPTTRELETVLGEPSDDMAILYLTPMTNPTSTIYDDKTLTETVQTFQRLRSEGYLLVDLAYIEMVDKERVKAMIRTLTTPETIDRVIMVTSMSKLFGDPRLRAGAIHTTNAELLKELQTHWQTVFASLSRPMELEALAKLSLISPIARERLFVCLRDRQEDVIALLDRINRERATRSQPPLVDMTRIHRDVPLYVNITLTDGHDFLDLFVETGILGVPGEVFGDRPENNRVRLALGMSI